MNVETGVWLVGIVIVGLLCYRLLAGFLRIFAPFIALLMILFLAGNYFGLNIKGVSAKAKTLTTKTITQLKSNIQ